MNTRLHLYSGWRLFHVPWRAALRIEPQDEYLRRQPRYTAARLIESRVPDGQPVFMLAGGEAAQSYTTRILLTPWESAFAEKIGDMIDDARNSAEFQRRRWTANFQPGPVREVIIIQAGSGTGQDMWSINEIRLWNGERAVPASPGWRLDAFPNPWDVAMAFDGSEATRWKSWEQLRPGMWIATHLDRPQELDRVYVTCSDGQSNSRMTAFALADDGSWKLPLLSGWQTDPPLDRRKEAMAAIKRAGVRYIAVSRQGWKGEPLRGDLQGWGLREIGSTRELSLLQVE